MAKRPTKGKAGVPQQMRGDAKDLSADYNLLSQQAEVWEKINKLKNIRTFLLN